MDRVEIANVVNGTQIAERLRAKGLAVLSPRLTASHAHRVYRNLARDESNGHYQIVGRRHHPYVNDARLRLSGSRA